MQAVFEGIEALPSRLRHVVLLALFSNTKECEEERWIVEIVFPQLFHDRPQRTFPFIRVTANDLLQANIPAEDVARLSESDIEAITQAMMTHYRDDLFWDELAFHAQDLLDRKQSGST